MLLGETLQADLTGCKPNVSVAMAMAMAFRLLVRVNGKLNCRNLDATGTRLRNLQCCSHYSVVSYGLAVGDIEASFAVLLCFGSFAAPHNFAHSSWTADCLSCEPFQQTLGQATSNSSASQCRYLRTDAAKSFASCSSGIRSTRDRTSVSCKVTAGKADFDRFSVVTFAGTVLQAVL